MFELEIELFKTLVPLIVAIIAAITAYLQKIKKDSALNELEYTHDALQMADEKVAALSDPKHASVDSVGMLPQKAWKMSDVTKNWLCSGSFAPFRASILSQIEDAENKNLVSYRIFVPNGVQYVIEYGLLKEQVGNT